MEDTQEFLFDEESSIIDEESPKRPVKRGKRGPKLVFPASVMGRLVRQIIQDLKPDFRVTDEAVLAIQTELEHYMHCFFNSCAVIAECASRDTITLSDFANVNMIRMLHSI